MKKFILTGLCASILVACGQQAESPSSTKPTTDSSTTTQQQTSQVAQKQLSSGIFLENVDKSIRPQDDFYQYVNGTWLKNAVIPADRTSVGSFHTLRENARDDVLAIIEELSKQNDLKPGSDEQKVASLYRSYMDEEKIEALGLQPLSDELNLINSIKNITDLSRYFSLAQINGIEMPIIFYVTVDAKVSTQYRAHFWQGGLSLPERDYYLDQSERYTKYRAELVKHIEKMFALAGFENPAESAKVVLAIETQIAENHWSKTDVRDSSKRYNKFAVKELSKINGELDWISYFAGLGIGEETEVIINQPSYIKGLGKIIADTSIDDWKTYLRWHLLTTRAEYLSKAFVKEDFEFFSKTLNGQQEQKPRWKRGVDEVSEVLGEVIGKIYVSRHFKPEAKTRMVELVENLRKAYGQGIDSLEWMSVETKVAAKDKLAKFKPKIGYPDIWRDYSALDIKEGELVKNLRRAAATTHRRDVNKLGGPIDQNEWGMTPQTVNAYYMPTKNEIVFPAAILQPPFFNMEADDAVNYGGIGAVIGHEMGHGFDDQGSKYDGDGNMRNWWTDEDLAEFSNRTKALVEQYSQYQVFDDLHVDGELTLGENIGDLAGVTIAYRAYKLSLNGKEAPVIDGLTGDQRFFMGFAQIWLGKRKEEALRNQVKTDPHSPGNFRALGSLSNMPEFYQAFDVKEGDKMYIPPEKRVKIW